MKDRRRFLQQAVATITAASSARFERAAGAGQKADPHERTGEPAGGAIPLVDTHVHLWGIDRSRLPWRAGGPPPGQTPLPDDYREAIGGLDVVQAVYMEVAVEPADAVAEADYAIELCRRRVGPLTGAVIGGRPASDDFRRYLDRFRDIPEVKGVRQILHVAATPPGYGLAPEFLRGLRLLGERGLSFDICMRSGELRDADRMIAACPDTEFVLDHCGNPSVRAADLSAWRDDIARLAERPNLVGKVSGIVASAAPDAWTPDDLEPIVAHVLASFGPDRVVFGGDWPVCTRAATLRQWVEALRHIVRDRSVAERRKLFHDNALRVYRLPAG